MKSGYIDDHKAAVKGFVDMGTVAVKTLLKALSNRDERVDAALQKH